MSLASQALWLLCTLLLLVFWVQAGESQRLMVPDVVLCDFATCAGGDGVAVDPVTGHIYMSDGGNNRVLRFAPVCILIRLPL